MLALVLLGLIACESAASFKFRRVNENHERGVQHFNTERDNHKMDVLNRKKEYIIRREENLNNEITNINRQQEDLNRQMEHIKKQKDGLMRKTEFLNRQKEQLEWEKEKLIADMTLINGNKRNHASAIVEGNEFKITIYLSGYNEEDIVVKSKKGLLIIQAIHNVTGEPNSNYFNVIILPDFVEGSGRWLYGWGVLRIVFSIIQRLNEYPKLTTPLDIKQLSKNENENTVNQNSANNISKRTFKDPATTNSTKNTDVPNQENEVKAIYVPNQGDVVKAITDIPIEGKKVTIEKQAIIQENGNIVPNQSNVEATIHSMPGDFIVQ